MVSGTAVDATTRAYFAELRAREYARLDAAGEAYLDYTGAGVYAASQVEAHGRWLARASVGNPHSDSPASRRGTEAVEEVRRRLLAFFGADPDEYTLVFTSNASAALKLVAESFPFERASVLALAADNHNSVLGTRAFATRAGARIVVLPLARELRLARPLDHLPVAGAAPSLLAFPAQSNFSGVRHPWALVEAARERGYRVLVDTAAYAPTHALRLSSHGPDFACVSFYKMLGHPTGLGALVARHDALAELARPWFAGGAVDFVSVAVGTHRLREGAGGFEDGTPDFLGVPALAAGLDLLDEVGMERLGGHVERLTARLVHGLARLRHAEGSAGVVRYGPGDDGDRGGTVAFNLVDRRGAVVPYEGVEKAVGRAGISIRGGCFCNPGAAEVAFGHRPDALADCLERLRDGFTPARLRDCLPDSPAVGALRASLGIASSEADVDRLIGALSAILNGLD